MLILSVVFVFPLFSQTGRSEVKFSSADGLEVHAEVFMLSDTLPYLVLVHEQGSSRGEFIQIINRFQKLNYNCLLPDIRNGGNTNIIINQSANRAKNENREITLASALDDIAAAVNFAHQKSGKKVILLGSGANGSLSIIMASKNENIKAVIALSPGEFYKPEYTIEEEIADLQVPLLVLATKTEIPYIQQLLSKVDPEIKTVFNPEFSTDMRGTKALYPENKTNLEYWLAVLLFFNNLN